MPGAPHIPLMAIRKIARMGHPVLQGVAKPVPDPTAPEVRALVRDMIETMIDANGAGLSARHPSLVAGVLYRDHKRGRDDASLVVAREAR